LNWATNLPAIEFCSGHYRTKGSYVKEVLAHPIASSLYVLRICVFTLGRNLAFQMVEWKALPAFESIACQNKDVVARPNLVVLALALVHIITDLALEADIGDQALRGF
jgi:hypothetical protein